MMAEMMLQSHLNFIHLLPAMPTAWANGSISGLCARGGFVVDMKWNNAILFEADVLSRLGYNCVLKSPIFKGKFSIIDTKTGLPVEYTRSANGLSFKTVAGNKYRIKSL